MRGLAFVAGAIAAAIRRELLGVLAACVLASARTIVVFGLSDVAWDIVKWAEWTLTRTWGATVLFLAGSVILMVVTMSPLRVGRRP